MQVRVSRIARAIRQLPFIAADNPRTEMPKPTAGPESQWRGYVPIALVAIFSLTVTWLWYLAVADWERQRVQIAFLKTRLRRKM